MKVLIIDDEESIRRFLTRILKANGFDVASIDDGDGAVLAAVAERPDLILMDMEMTRTTGVEAIRALKADPATRAIPIIMLTGLATPDRVVSAIQAGAVDFILKSGLRIDELLMRVRKILPAAPAEPSVGEKRTAVKSPAAARRPKRAAILARDRVESHLEDSVELRALPFVAAEALKIASTPNADVAQLSQTLARDPSLSATLLQLSNSAFFTVQNRVQSLNQAVMRLGLRRVGEIVTAIKLVEEFRGGGKKSGIDRIELWRHSLAVAVLARDLAQAGKLPPDSVEGAFLAGLLHDLGQAFLADHFPAPYAKVVALASKQAAPLHDVERETCGIDHAEVARRILSRWKFHPEFVEAVAQHEALPETAGLRAVLWLADLLARAARTGTDGDDTVDLVPDELVARVGLDGDRVEQVLAGMDEQVRELAEILLLHPSGSKPPPPAPPELKEGVQAVLVVQTPRLVEPVELFLRRRKWQIRRAHAVGDVAVDPAVQAVVLRSRTTEWLREQLEQAVEAGAAELAGRRPLLVCPEGAFPRELKGVLKELGGAAVEHPLSIGRLIKSLQAAGDRR